MDFKITGINVTYRVNPTPGPSYINIKFLIFMVKVYRRMSL